MESVEFVVVGAGVAGLSTAWRLAAAGHEVLVLERFALGHDRGSSHGATRIFRFAYDDPTYVRLAQAALPLWRELEDATGEEILRVTGGFDVGDDGYLERCASALESCDATVEQLDGMERRRRFPWFEAGDQQAVYSPDTGVLAAARALEAMATAARAAGAVIRENDTVKDLRVEEDAVTIATGSGELRARRCILAMGAWVARHLDPFVELPILVSREQVFYFRADEDIVPFIHHGPVGRYGVPAFAGAAGVKIAEHMTGETTSADGRSVDMDPEGAARVSAYVREMLPGLDPEPVAFETCLYTITPDHGFVLDRMGPIVVASPCSGHGFKFGPIVGETLARLATDREPPIPIDPFALKRFG